ncbi:MAG TPA: hypothetical protein DCL61_13005 [Cyanobacteria bacterium UBA12227]|nr:hypothetical protein [Cyanobacteria bacterium UBA12227]HAX88330.1 hypothetical protein [Cyanobacteria bacterium UBA11370]HBY81139.1 hypothetical protein [Cyanobacteria bacterium UBA11148]
MIKPIGYQTDIYQLGYQQALDDFGLSDLLLKLSNFSEQDLDTQWLNSREETLDLIAVWLIEQLTASLKGNLISSYLNAMPHGDSHRISDLPLVDPPLPQASALPTDFSIPQFKYGEHLRWKLWGGLVETDTGVVIGRVYLPASHRGFEWSWKYLILLDQDSPSSAIVTADTAWEDDLEPF